jgi:hypothetical protein
MAKKFVLTLPLAIMNWIIMAFAIFILIPMMSSMFNEESTGPSNYFFISIQIFLGCLWVISMLIYPRYYRRMKQLKTQNVP